jgi:hypothetical protein
MRKLLYSMMSIAAVAVFAMPALAQPSRYHAYHPGYRAYDYASPVYHRGYPARAAAPAAGVVGGTVAGVGVPEGWWGAAATAALPATAAGAAAVGGVAGIGAVAAVDAMIEPCRGFAALFDLSHGECVNGHYVGNAPGQPVPPYRYQ